MHSKTLFGYYKYDFHHTHAIIDKLSKKHDVRRYSPFGFRLSALGLGLEVDKHTISNTIWVIFKNKSSIKELVLAYPMVSALKR